MFSVREKMATTVPHIKYAKSAQQTIPTLKLDLISNQERSAISVRIFFLSEFSFFALQTILHDSSVP